MDGKTTLDRCYDLIDWINANPNIRRRNFDAALALGISEGMVSKITTRDFPQCFARIPRIGLTTTGMMPERGEFDHRVKKFKWDAETMDILNRTWKSGTGNVPMKDLHTLDKESITTIKMMGEHLSELARQILESGVIGTEAQAEWRPA